MSTISDWTIERLALGELPEAEANALRAELRAAGDDRLARIEASNAEILADYPPLRMAEAIRTRVDIASSRQTHPAWIWFPAGLAIAAVLALLWVWRAPGGEPESLEGVSIAQRDPSGPETIRFKGDPALLLYRQLGETRVQVAAGTIVEAGEVLQVAYRASGAQHGVILSIDGRQVVTLHFPGDPAASTALNQGGVIALEHGYELDDAPAFERFFLVTASEPIDVAQVKRAAERIAAGSEPMVAPLDLDVPLQEHSLLVRKAE